MPAKTIGRPVIQWRLFLIKIVSPAVLTFCFLLGFIFVEIIPSMRRNIVDHKRTMIRELTQVVCSELDGLYEQEVRGELTRAEAQAAAIARLNSRRFGDDRKDYFWITDMHPRMVMHPYRPDLNGQDLSEYQDQHGVKLFVEFTEVVREQGAGYKDYLWQWKYNAQRISPKLSYVSGFKPWGWIVGTGVYLDDVNAEIQEITRQTVIASLVISGIVALLLLFIAHQSLKLEQKRWEAESALRESEEKHRVLLSNTTEGVLMVLRDRPFYANKTLLDQLGYTERELADLTLDKLIQPTSGQSAKLIGKNGTATDVLLATAAVQIGDQAGQVFSFKDITAYRKNEEAMSRLMTELQTTLPLTTQPVKSASISRLSCDLNTTIRQAAASMAQHKCDAILVRASANGEPIGIVTDQDLCSRVLAAGVDPGRPISSIMSAPLVEVDDNALLFEAGRMMQERSIQHLAVRDSSGEIAGILGGRVILHAQRHSIGLLLGEIERAGEPEALQACYARLPSLVRPLLDNGTRIEHVNRMISRIADAILARVGVLAEAQAGPPPVPYAFVVFGSAARGEMTLFTDQDNAIVYADVSEAERAATQAYFLRLGETVCQWLDRIGYRRCKGESMASNPKWCQPLGQWRHFFSDCIATATPQDLVDVNIFFDLRCAFGETDHVMQLRQHLQQLLESNQEAFFYNLAQSTLQFRPPRGFFGNIQVEQGGGNSPSFNIKSAIIPIVNFARIYALRHQLVEVNTLDRLARLRDYGVLRPSSHDELVQGYSSLVHMRLTHQVAQIGRGEEPDNHIVLAELTQLERSILKKVFADIVVFQGRLQNDFMRTS